LGVTISADTIVVRDNEPIAAEVDDEIVILSAKAEAYFGLGAIGSDIWGMIATPCRISDVCTRLVEDYDVDRQTCERDTMAFMEKLLEGRLIRIVDKDSAGS
jgi:Coenzyme PQQ synthesis protein D (PqqD)